MFISGIQAQVHYRLPYVNSDYIVKLFDNLNLLSNSHCLCHVCGYFNLPNVNWFNMSEDVSTADNCLVNFVSHKS